MTPPVPNVIALVTLFVLMVDFLIYAGYVHGNMHLLTVLKNAWSAS